MRNQKQNILPTGEKNEFQTNSSFPGVFCLAWKFNSQTCSIWTGNVLNALKLLFTLKIKPRLIYFPSTGEKQIELFKRSI